MHDGCTLEEEVHHGCTWENGVQNAHTYMLAHSGHIVVEEEAHNGHSFVEEVYSGHN